MTCKCIDALLVQVALTWSQFLCSQNYTEKKREERHLTVTGRHRRTIWAKPNRRETETRSEAGLIGADE